MMNCETCSDSLSAYIDRELEAGEAYALEGHLEGCAPCRDIHQSLVSLVTTVHTVPQPMAPKGFSEQVRTAVLSNRPDGEFYQESNPSVATKTPRIFHLGFRAAAAAVVLVASTWFAIGMIQDTNNGTPVSTNGFADADGLEPVERREANNTVTDPAPTREAIPIPITNIGLSKPEELQGLQPVILQDDVPRAGNSTVQLVWIRGQGSFPASELANALGVEELSRVPVQAADRLDEVGLGRPSSRPLYWTEEWMTVGALDELVQRFRRMDRIACIGSRSTSRESLSLSPLAQEEQISPETTDRVRVLVVVEKY